MDFTIERLCERETKKVLRLRLSNNDRENCDNGSMILNMYITISYVRVSISVLINFDRL